MASRRWVKAAEIYESLLQNENGYNDDKLKQELTVGISYAYLAMGKLKEAKAMFENNNKEPGAAPPDILALGFMIDNQFSEAIRILKRSISQTYIENPNGMAHSVEAGMLMEVHLNLGKCYRARNRLEDSDEAYAAGIFTFEAFKDDALKKIPPADDGETSVWRCDARVLMVYGELLERANNVPEAKKQHEAAKIIIFKTIFAKDDSILDWEYENCLAALERTRMNLPPPPDVDRSLWKKLMELRVSNAYRIEWYSFMNSDIPRFRGGDNGWSSKILGDQQSRAT